MSLSSIRWCLVLLGLGLTPSTRLTSLWTRRDLRENMTGERAEYSDSRATLSLASHTGGSETP